MNNLAALILLGALSAAGPASALEPAPMQTGRGGSPPADQGPRAGMVQAPSPSSSQSPASQSNVTADPAQQIEPEGGPPAGALSLSQIIAQIESRPDFAFIRDIDWDDGRYDVQYRTRDGRDRNLKVDPRTGRPVEGALPTVHWPKS
jgi:hypothetical protein